MTLHSAGRRSARQLLDQDGNIWSGYFASSGVTWDERRPNSPLTKIDVGQPYFVEALAVDFHCHGVGSYDFGNLRAVDLDEIEALLAAQGVQCVVAAHMLQQSFTTLPDVLARYKPSKHRHILGFALEGPLLKSVGGAPLATSWMPTRAQWRRLTRFGGDVIRYVVLSPDFQSGVSSPPSDPEGHPDVGELIEMFVEAGISPAFGHFGKKNPESTARITRRMIDRAIAARIRYGVRTSLLTDHLMNDMPCIIPYAWRSKNERAERDRDLISINTYEWKIENLSAKIGPVPTVLIRAAHDAELTACLNFDGDHVDPVICEAIIRLTGADNIIAITDRVESPRLAGLALTPSHENSLLYQSQGIVAAGTQSVAMQARTMRNIGLTEKEIWKLTSLNARRVLSDNAGRSHLLKSGITFVPGISSR
jgi:N-acetylglucosamine-6-phosphate deacetylase